MAGANAVGRWRREPDLGVHGSSLGRTNYLSLDEISALRYRHEVSSQAQAVLADALRLPVRDRADVAAELLRSLDAEESEMPAEEVERLWAAEITRRAERAIRGESVGRDAEEVLEEVERQLRRR